MQEHQNAFSIGMLTRLKHQGHEHNLQLFFYFIGIEKDTVMTYTEASSLVRITLMCRVILYFPLVHGQQESLTYSLHEVIIQHYKGSYHQAHIC